MYPYFYPNYSNQTPAAPMGGTTPMAGMPKMYPPVAGTTSGTPAGPISPTPPTIEAPVTDFEQEQGPPVITDIDYTQAYLKTQIGKKVRIEFLIGTNMFTDRIGTLVNVGISYVLIRPEGTDDIMLCDIYSIKFVTFYL